MRTIWCAFKLAGTPGFEPGTEILEISMIAISPRPLNYFFISLYGSWRQKHSEKNNVQGLQGYFYILYHQ